MDVPFISSGAMSRAHYALVRKVETATSIPAADQLLLTEIEMIRERFAHTTLTETQTKECLILLLYCSMTLSWGVTVNMDFALPHAINLTGAGRTIQNKRTGYMYCAEMLPKDHELSLMLVNTLRKDLESESVSSICLALDALIQSPSADVIPAIQDRLHDLLSHNSMHVRRKTLFAFRALSTCHPDILERVVDKIIHRLRDHDSPVVIAALTVSVSLIEAGLISTDKLRGIVASRLEDTWLARGIPAKRAMLVKILEVLGIVRPSAEVCKVILEIVRACSQKKSSANVVLEQCFLAAGAASIGDVLSAQSALKTSFVANIRHLLVSSDPNEIYLFLTCLCCIEPRLWAGNTPDIPAVLQGWEVERIMQLLDSSDPIIRTKTLSVLARVDTSIVEAYYKQFLQVDRTAASDEEISEASRRLMEIIGVLYAEDGESYAHNLRDIISLISPPSTDKPLVLQEIVEEVLTVLRKAEASFRSASLGVLFALLAESQQPLGPTMTVITAALTCEYLDLSPLPPARVLQGLSSQLPLCNAAIQEACLLSMIRAIASCEDVPENAVAVVRKIQEQSGRHIKRRCEQFLSLSHSRTIVTHILAKSKSSSLPDFLISLEAYEAEKMSQATRSPSLGSVSSQEHERPSSRASSQASRSPRKLRYTAYDAPQMTSSLRRIRSKSPYSDSASSRFVGEDNEGDDPLSRTITAGDLALATGHIELQTLSKSPPSTLASLKAEAARKEDELASRVDLIALDSPFIADPPISLSGSQSELDFKETWDKFPKANMRGWCESSIDTVVRKLQAMQRTMRVTAADQPPFEGDLKILILTKTDRSLSNSVALLRLKEGEDDSCIWHLRCEDSALRDSIGTVLKEA